MKIYSAPHPAIRKACVSCLVADESYLRVLQTNAPYNSVFGQMTVAKKTFWTSMSLYGLSCQYIYNGELALEVDGVDDDELGEGVQPVLLHHRVDVPLGRLFHKRVDLEEWKEVGHFRDIGSSDR